MGLQIPQIPVGEEAISVWQNKVSRAIPANRLASSADFNISQTNNGTTISSKDSGVESHFIKDAGEYNALSHYGPNDMVFVYPNTVYTSSVGTVVSASAGTWLCQHAVPDMDISDNIKVTFPGSLSASYVDYIRITGVNYAPIWPEPIPAVDDTTDGKGKYWRLIGVLPTEMVMCVNGVSSTVYIGMIPSGSNSV